MTSSRRRILWYVAVLIPSIAATAVSGGAEQATALENRRELFVDHHLIESMEGMELRMHRPHVEGVAIAFDQPWEGPFSAYGTVIKDGELYRMYYRGLPDPNVENRKAVTCYAESRDGITWTKPALGLFEYAGSRKNNIVLATEDVFSRNFSPFLDTRLGVPSSERYKAIAGDEGKGLLGFVSPDGIRWEKASDNYIFTEGMFDSHNVAFWSEAEECYVCYFRTWTGEGYTGFRTISRTTSQDFLNWTDPVEVTYGDTPQEQLYTNGTHPYYRAPHIYIALAKRFFPDKPGYTGADASTLVANEKYRSTSSDSVLMTTRGGSVYDRTFMEAFIRPGDTARDWIARDNTPALGVVAGDERTMFLYRLSHYAQPTSHLTRYSLRVDGFASAHADYAGGTLTTRPISFSGNQLEINFETSAAGEIRVEFLDQDHSPIPDYQAEDCLPILGNEISRIVTWRHGKNVSNLAGKTVRLRFHCRDADLYSFQFQQTSP